MSQVAIMLTEPVNCQFQLLQVACQKSNANFANGGFDEFKSTHQAEKIDRPKKSDPTIFHITIYNSIFIIYKLYIHILFYLQLSPTILYEK